MGTLIILCPGFRPNGSVDGVQSVTVMEKTYN